jgi:hypothetical protein
MFDHTRPWYHWKDGLYFQRQENGDVTIAKFETAHDNSAITAQYSIPAAEWASIVSAVTVTGETGETYQRAVELHAS